MQHLRWGVRFATLLCAAALASAANAQSVEAARIRMSAATVAAGDTLSLSVDAIGSGIGSLPRSVRTVSYTTTCGSVSAAGVFTAPDHAATCTVTATYTTSDGVSGRTTATIAVERPLAGAAPPPPPPPPAAVEASADSILIARIPRFLDPIPRPTSRTLLPHRLVGIPATANAPVTLGAIADKLQAAMDAGAIEYSIYAVGDSGFAFVTRTEMIDAHGRVSRPRFPNDLRAVAPADGALDFLKGLFFAQPGYFRVIAMVVSGRPVITSSDQTLDAQRATNLVAGGAMSLPESLRRIVVRSPDCVALIYEYERQSAVAGVVKPRTAPLVPPRLHLARAGLWSDQQLGLR